MPFIENAAKSAEPFLAVIWFHSPHLPVVAGKEYRDLYADHSLKKQLYYGCITAMDQQVGRLRTALRDLRIADNTIVWFASDNGPENGTPGSPGKFRGRKRSLYEGGVRVPGLDEWPARIAKARESDVPAVTSDYFPTVLDYLGLTMKGQPDPIDGVSLRGLIEGTMTQRPHPIGFQSDRTATLSDNRFKLVVSSAGSDKRQRQQTAELYDLIADPYEQNNIASELGEYAEVTARMTLTLRQWQASCAKSNAGGDYR